MQGAFGTVVWVVCGVGIIGAVLGLVFNGRTWEEYGKNHLLLETDRPRSSAVATAERDAEIRQLLEARNLRRRRRGELLLRQKNVLLNIRLEN